MKLRGLLWRPVSVAALVIGLTAAPVSAQPMPGEQNRESWQRTPDIFAALGVRPGAVIADVGAGQGYFTERLAKALAPNGKVYAVDISATALRQLQDRIRTAGLTNVEVVHGDVADPKLPAAALDAALIINAYHEMTEHQAVLANIRAALKPAGRLVIVEPISDARRDGTRDSQTRQHQIASHFVQEEARAAGFRIVGLEEPFANRPGHDYEYMLVVTPAPAVPPPTVRASAPAQRPDAAPEDDTSAPELRISAADFAALQRSGRVIVLDVRDAASYARGHIPGARSAPFSELRDLAAELKNAAVPIVTYCDCPAEESSARAALTLRNLGVANVHALLGGIDTWIAGGGAIVTGPSPK